MGIEESFQKEPGIGPRVLPTQVIELCSLTWGTMHFLSFGVERPCSFDACIKATTNT